MLLSFIYVLSLLVAFPSFAAVSFKSFQSFGSKNKSRLKITSDVDCKSQLNILLGADALSLEGERVLKKYFASSKVEPETLKRYLRKYKNDQSVLDSIKKIFESENNSGDTFLLNIFFYYLEHYQRRVIPIISPAVIFDSYKKGAFDSILGEESISVEKFLKGINVRRLDDKTPEHYRYLNFRTDEQLSSSELTVWEKAPQFDVLAIAKDYDLSLLQAVEAVQKYLILSKYSPASDKVFNKAIKFVRGGNTVSGVTQEKIDEARFIAVFDIDGMFLDQDYQRLDTSYHQYSFKGVHGKMRHVSMAPNWEYLFHEVKKQNGMIVIYSRSADVKTRQLMRSVKINVKGKKIPLVKFVDGVMGNKYLFSTEQSFSSIEDINCLGCKSFKKNLELFNVDKTIIIDDNPDYVVQHENLRHVVKYEVAKYKESPLYRHMIDNQFFHVVHDIKAALEMSEKEGITLKEAFLPYSRAR